MNKKIIKNILGYSSIPCGKLFTNFLKIKNRTLLFHSIDENLIFDNYGFTVSLTNFKNYINYLKSNEFQFTDLKDTIYNNKSITITFDDGYKNIIPALEYLDKLSIPCSIFIITSKLKDKIYLSSNEISELSQNKLFTIGSHSHTHPNLSRLDNTKTKNEILTSVKILQDLTNKNINTFSFPFGKYNYDNLITLKKLKINRVCSSNYGFNTSFQKLINRIEITKSDDVNTFIKKLDGFYDYLYLRKFL